MRVLIQAATTNHATVNDVEDLGAGKRKVRVGRGKGDTGWKLIYISGANNSVRSIGPVLHPYHLEDTTRGFALCTVEQRCASATFRFQIRIALHSKMPLLILLIL